MSSPKQNATPAEMAALAKLNKKLYGTKPEIGPGKSMAGGDISGDIKAIIAAEKAKPKPRPEPTRPTPPMPKRPDPLPLPPKRPDPIPSRPEPTRPTPPMPKRPTPMPQPVKPLPPMEPKRPTPMPTPDRGSMPALRPTGKPSNQMEYKKGGSVPSASKRGDGIAQRGKTRGKMR